MSARSFSRNGEGVLIIMQGDEAINYIKDEVLLKEAKVYEITNANDDKVNAFFMNFSMLLKYTLQKANIKIMKMLK